jgi:hypothetical protein
MSVENPAPIYRIDEIVKDQLLDGRLDRFSRDDVSALRTACDRVKDFLSETWRYGIGDGDFFIHTGAEDQKMLCVEVTDARILNHEFFRIGYAAVEFAAAEYIVDFCNAFGSLETEKGSEHPAFNIFVSKDQILVYSEYNGLLADLGIGDITNLDESVRSAKRIFFPPR